MADRRVLRVLIVDDEPLGCQRLVNLLRREPHVEIAAVAEDGDEAIEAIRTLSPDVVFLDVQMPGMSGIDVLHELGPDEMPPTIFVTAYDQYAVHAFQLAAVDYLVKPYDDERFKEALARARQKLEFETMGVLHAKLLELLQADSESVAPLAVTSGKELERIAVRARGRMRVVPVAEIDYITASGPYVELHVGKQRYLVRLGIHNLQRQLPPDFIRIHRSVIVRLDLIESVERVSTGGHEVHLKSGPRLPVGRSRREALERRLGRV